MEPIKKKSELYRRIRELVEGTPDAAGDFPSNFTYCEGKGGPVFTFTVERTQEDFFIDDKGQKWVKAPQ